MRSILCVLVILGTLSFVACGASNLNGGAEQPIDFVYVKDGNVGRLSDLRDRPVVLVLMRTSEVVSQIHIANVAKLYEERAGKLRFLVLSVEEADAPFVKVYAEFEQLPFTIGLAEHAVVLGESMLGVVPALPFTCFIEPSGRVRASSPGVLTVETMIEEADRLLDF